MEKKFSVKELVEAISGLPDIDQFVAIDLIKGEVDEWTKKMVAECNILESKNPTLIRAIKTWNLDFLAHKDDAILLLLEELLEDVRCEQQPGKAAEAQARN